MLDERDQAILNLLVTGRSNSEIAARLKIPVSTVQRRTRKLFERDLVRINYQLNYEKLGWRKGLLHIYLKNGDATSIANQVAKIQGVQSTAVHIGNSDIVASFLFNETPQLLGILTRCKELSGVERVVWSEEVQTFYNSKEQKKR